MLPWMRRVARKPGLSAALESSPAPLGRADGVDIDGTEVPESAFCVVLRCVCVCVCVCAYMRVWVLACVLAHGLAYAHAYRPYTPTLLTLHVSCAAPRPHSLLWRRTLPEVCHGRVTLAEPLCL